MAKVYFARLLGPVGFSRVVAIKRLHEHLATDPEFVSMFLDEARLAARVRHPNVVSTLDVVATKGELFLVMEYVQGESLARLLRTMTERKERIPPRIVVGIISGVLQGLHAAHEAVDEGGEPLNLVHRDVSPQNILVGSDGLSRVLDFGIAKAVGRAQNTKDNTIKGKLSYMAPEQLRRDNLGRGADVYSVAVVLWEALTTTRLFGGASEAAIVTRVVTGEVKKPSEVDPSLVPFDDVVMKGLAVVPEDRHPTARAMATVLEACIGVASTAEIADWLENVAGPALRERAATLAEIEKAESTPSDKEDPGLAEAVKFLTREVELTAEERRARQVRTAPMDFPVPGRLVAASGGSTGASALPGPAPSTSPSPSPSPSTSTSTSTRTSRSEITDVAAELDAGVPRRGRGPIVAVVAAAALVVVIGGVLAFRRSDPTPESRAPAAAAATSSPAVSSGRSAVPDPPPPLAASATAPLVASVPPIASNPPAASTSPVRPAASARPRTPAGKPKSPFEGLGGRE